MRGLFIAVLLVIIPVSVVADPPDENVLNPRINAAGEWFFQVQGGINLTLLDGGKVVRQQNLLSEQPTTIYESASGIGLLGGLTVGYFFTPNIGFAVSADYDVRYASNAANTVDTCLIRDAFGTIVKGPTIPTSKEYSLRVDYASVALLGTFRFDNWLLMLGPTVSIPLSGRLQEESDLLGDSINCYYFAGTPDQSQSIVGVNTRADSINTRISVKFAAAYVFRLSRQLSIVPQVGFDVGLTNTYSEHPTLVTTGETTGTTQSFFPNYNKGIRLNALQATLGIRFNL